MKSGTGTGSQKTRRFPVPISSPIPIRPFPGSDHLPIPIAITSASPRSRRGRSISRIRDRMGNGIVRRVTGPRRLVVLLVAPVVSASERRRVVAMLPDGEGELGAALMVAAGGLRTDGGVPAGGGIRRTHGR